MRSAWLGIDVGSGASKVLNFCLIEQKRGLPFSVSFERGQVRVANPPYPPNRAGVFEQLDRWPPVSTAAEWHVRAVINASELVTRWRSSETDATVAVVDAPIGFASGNGLIRATERLAAMSYPTPAAPLFLEQMRSLSEAGNNTPLRQRYFWKLVGLIAFDELASILGFGHPDSFTGELAELSSAAGPRRIREGFPSDSYARLNGRAGFATPDVRDALGLLASVPWESVGNLIGGRSSSPTTTQMAQLEAKRRELSGQVGQPGALAAMTKAAGDPRWGDLWDAFCLAAVGYAEGLQATRLLATTAETHREGTILTFDSLPTSSAQRGPPKAAMAQRPSVGAGTMLPTSSSLLDEEIHEGPGEAAEALAPVQNEMTIEELTNEVASFVDERQWRQFHSPRNLAAALAVEAGELLELFQWLTDEQSRSLSAAKRDRVRDEIGDVLIYLLRLADELDVDLVTAAAQKLEKNRQKYPAERVQGDARKYDEY